MTAERNENGFTPTPPGPVTIENSSSERKSDEPMALRGGETKSESVSVSQVDPRHNREQNSPNRDALLQANNPAQVSLDSSSSSSSSSIPRPQDGAESNETTNRGSESCSDGVYQQKVTENAANKVHDAITKPQNEADQDTRMTNEKSEGRLSDGESEMAEGSAEEASLEDIGEGKKARIQKRGSKLDRSTLRKGKWTIEEEEYTSRIIHHFSTGLLTLPEGTTLRSYLADKLNCDPMRITKKFAGASCLGKRVYHLCDRSQATVTDIEIAKTELSRLEHRFRLRIEHGQSGIPLPPRAEATPVVSSSVPAFVAPGHPQHAPASVAASWLQSIASQMANAQASGNIPLAPNQIQPMPGMPAAPGQIPWPFITQNQQPTQWVIPTPSGVVASSPSTMNSMPPPNHPVVQNATTEAISLAWAQAAASLTPALSQLAAANLQQHQQQLQNAYESQLRSYTHQNQKPAPAPESAPKPASLTHMPILTFPTSQPQQQQQLQHKAHTSPVHIQPALSVMAPPPNVARVPKPLNHVPIAPNSVHSTAVSPNQQRMHPPATPATLQPRPAPLPKKTLATSTLRENFERTKEDEAAGSMLMGFLTSLHQGFLEAKSLKEREDREEVERAAKALQPETNETSSGTTSYPADSSPDDSEEANSNKDPSSSEESDNAEKSRGPPRKRLKTIIGEFTSKNVAAHTTRMNALHQAERQHLPTKGSTFGGQPSVNGKDGND